MGKRNVKETSKKQNKQEIQRNRKKYWIKNKHKQKIVHANTRRHTQTHEKRGNL